MFEVPEAGLPELCISFQQIMGCFLTNYAPKIRNYANWAVVRNTFKQKFLMLQIIKLANLLWFYF